MSVVLLAYVAGVVTLVNPCVLPVLPIVIGSSLCESRYGPAVLAAGLVLSFSVFGLGILAFGFSVGLDQEAVRVVAAAILVVAGILLALPRAQAVFASATAPIASGGNRLLGRVSGQGLAGQFVVGALLGLVWTPCVGPTLGVAIASASQGQNLMSAFGIFLVFGLGVATSLLAFAYGSRRALAARKEAFAGAARWGKPVFGGLLVVVGLMIASGLDKTVEAMILRSMPDWLVAFTVRF